MKVMWLFVALAAGCLAMKCADYKCGNNNSNEGECITWTVTGMTIIPCKDGLACLMDNKGVGMCKKPGDIKGKYAGEYCESNPQCRTDNCVNNVCVGKKDGKCTTHADCDVEQFCDKEKCAKIEGACSVANNKPCKSNEVCNGDVCVRLASIDNGKPSQVPAACKSYYIKDKKCEQGPTLKREDKGMCVYQVGKDPEYTDTKVCVRDSKGSSFCDPGRGKMNINDVNCL
eukprot:TRINITY_DN10617_c0_g2_i2.p1 TRINITY_DN10617_c0_g2~~TRINITY_DN10617_c0_g2_i2.p1  ORF type:complete len:229 (+),score=52.04 TRINITY_DN10617_c0_g2_i2:696-1382(+)